MRMVAQWICPAVISACQDFLVKLSDEDEWLILKGAMVGVNERLKKTGYFVPSKVEEKEGCFYFFPHFCRLRSRSTLLYPHLIIISPVFFYFSIYIRMYIKKVRVTIFHLLSSNQEMKRSFPSYYRQKAPSE